MSSKITRIAEAAAAMYGVETGWVDAQGRPRTASEATIRLALRGLGAPVTDTSDLADASRFRRAAMWRRVCPPVRVVRPGGSLSLPLRLPARAVAGRLAWSLFVDGEPASSGEARLAELSLVGGRMVDGEQFEIRKIDVPVPVPAGYHRLTLRFGAADVRVHVIGAPPAAYRSERVEGRWGLFHPLYGLRGTDNGRVGSIGTLASALDWTARQGGAVFGTTPLLAAFDDTPFDPSPYAPASRLFWNDFYVDLDGESIPPTDEDLVRYEELFRVRRTALTGRADSFFARGGSTDFEFQQFLHRMPEVSMYARFRAACTQYGRNWRSWPQPARSGRIPDEVIDRSVVRRHIYAQWLADRQLATLGGEADAGLFLDVPLGTHPDAYDVWSRQDLFAHGVSAGAPPDDFHREGQDWGLPPTHPDRIREEGYAYFAATLRHTMRYAALVRLDHVMQLRRLYWVPAGCPASAGVYVRYPAAELAAVMALESQKARCEVVGEDLGTVPEPVRELMDLRAIRRTWVLGFSLPAGPHQPLGDVPPGAVAAIGTHDTAPLRGLRAGVDINDREARGLLEVGEATTLRAERIRQFLGLAAATGSDESGEDDGLGVPDPSLPGVVRILRRSRAGLVMLPLDDLAGQTLPQNVPGTTTERPNWRRRLPTGLATLGTSPGAVAVLEAMRGEAP
ncbi:MAG: 4-alpha-glucanotransferase [Gemmatimonadota bacterium]